jgi:hypothetical protein
MPAFASAQSAFASHGVDLQPAAVAMSGSPSIGRAAAQGMARGGRIWAGSMLGALVGTSVGAAWSVKQMIADDGHPAAIAGFAVVGGFAGLGVGTIIGMVLPNRSHAPGSDPRLHVQPMVYGPERGALATLVF